MLQQFFAMGGYAPYVWSCYGLTLAALVFMAVSGRSAYQREFKAARRRAVSETSVDDLSL